MWLVECEKTENSIKLLCSKRIAKVPVKCVVNLYSTAHAFKSAGWREPEYVKGMHCQAVITLGKGGVKLLIESSTSLN